MDPSLQEDPVTSRERARGHIKDPLAGSLQEGYLKEFLASRRLELARAQLLRGEPVGQNAQRLSGMRKIRCAPPRSACLVKGRPLTPSARSLNGDCLPDFVAGNLAGASVSTSLNTSQ